MKKEIIYSSHWQKHSKQCDGFGDLQYKKLWHKIASWLCIKSYLGKISNSFRVIRLLPKAKIICKRLGTYFSYDCFRQVCSLALILKYKSCLEKILIAGDGYGFLACLLRELFPKSRIVLIDIPEILKFQRKAISSAEFYTPDKINAIQGEFDIIINVASMQEMTNKMIEQYFILFRRTIGAKGFFYCCNRVEKKLCGGEITNIFKYPWHENDRFVVDEEPDFYKYYFQWKPPFKKYFDGKMWQRLARLERLGDIKTVLEVGDE